LNLPPFAFIALNCFQFLTLNWLWC